MTAKGVDETALQGAIFGTGDWDIAWVPLNVNSPDQLVPFLSGPGMADGGTNFSGIDNADYTDGVTAASAMDGTDGCETWLEAESELVAAADIVPFANNVVKTFGNGAEFEYPGHVHAHQHPDAGEVADVVGELGRRPDPTGGSPLPPVGPVRGTPARSPAGVPVGAGDGVVPDDPPDPRATRCGRPSGRPHRPALVAAKREEMGLDDPILVQYWHYLQGLFTGDLGTSMISQLPVADVVAQRLPATLELALLGVPPRGRGCGAAWRHDGCAHPARSRPAHAGRPRRRRRGRCEPSSSWMMSYQSPPTSTPTVPGRYRAASVTPLTVGRRSGRTLRCIVSAIPRSVS